MTAPWPAALLQEVGIPVLFMGLWSTGFIGARLGLPHAGPFTFLALRFGISARLLVLVALATRAPWPRRQAKMGHYGAAGLLVHGVYLGGVYIGISLGISALIVGLQPLLTAALARALLGERVSPRQWVGLGLGLLGIWQHREGAFASHQLIGCS